MGGVGWGGYLRPDQFLDHLTVIKMTMLIMSSHWLVTLLRPSETMFDLANSDI